MVSGPVPTLPLPTAASALEDHPISIADTAETARQLLMCCKHIDQERPRCIAIAQLDRFNLWASNIGVFSSSHASLDYRLRTAPDAKLAVIGNLDMLCMDVYSVLAGRSDLEDADYEVLADTSPEGISKLGMRVLHASPPSTEARIEKLESVKKVIGNLHQLSLAIRKASNRNSLARVPRLLGSDQGFEVLRVVQEPATVSSISVDPVWFDSTSEFEEFLRRILKARWLRLDESVVLEPHHEEYRQHLLERLVMLVATRRRQLAYFQRHQTKLATSGAVKFAGKEDEKMEAKRPPNAEILPDRVKQLSLSASRQLDGGQPVSETVPSEFMPVEFKMPPSIAPPSSAPSSSDSVVLSGIGPFEVPPPPELAPDENEKMCPYCCLVLPARTFDTQRRSKRWRKHLRKDLQPYICLFKNCSQPAKMYRTFREWQRHLSEPHFQHWVCPLNHPRNMESATAASEGQVQTLIFDTMEEFQEHLMLEHPEIDASASQSLVWRAGQPMPLPNWCFVCQWSGSESEHATPVALQRHLATHLEQAFLLALPERTDINDADASSSRRLSAISAVDEGSRESHQPMAPPVAQLTFLFMVHQLMIQEPEYDSDRHLVPPTEPERYARATSCKILRYVDGTIEDAPEYHCFEEVGTKERSLWHFDPQDQREMPIIIQEHSKFAVFACNPLRPIMVADRDPSASSTKHAWQLLQLFHPHDLGLSGLTQVATEDSPYGIGQGPTNFTAGENPSWIPNLIPQMYQRRSPGPPSSGLGGELAIILGLMALSAEPDSSGISNTNDLFLGGCWRGNQWRASGPPKGHPRTSGEVPRGFLAVVFCDPMNPEGSTPETLHAFQWQTAVVCES